MTNIASNLSDSAAKLVRCAERLYQLHDAVCDEGVAHLHAAFQSNAGDALSIKYKQLGEEIKSTGDFLTAVAEGIQQENRRSLLMGDKEGV